MKKYRCMLCAGDRGLPGRDFQAEKPACPNCGLDSTADPRDAQYIVELATVHFDPPFHAKRGNGHAACDKSLTLGKVSAMTGEPDCVNCDACRKTPEWMKAMKDRGKPAVHPDADVVVEANPEKGVLEYDLKPPGV